MERHNLFPGIEYPLVHYNGKAVYNQVFPFFNSDGETDYDFDDFVSVSLDVYSKREGKLLKSFTPTRSSNDIIFNASAEAMEFDDLGKYYYEMSYLQSGGYEVILLYGDFNVI